MEHLTWVLINQIKQKKKKHLHNLYKPPLLAGTLMFVTKITQISHKLIYNIIYVIPNIRVYQATLDPRSLINNTQYVYCNIPIIVKDIICSKVKITFSGFILILVYGRQEIIVFICSQSKDLYESVFICSSNDFIQDVWQRIAADLRKIFFSFKEKKLTIIFVRIV